MNGFHNSLRHKCFMALFHVGSWIDQDKLALIIAGRCRKFQNLLNYRFAHSNRGEWLWSPANIKRANKEAKIYVGRSTTVHNLLFCVHTLCMSNVTKTLLLVSSSVSSKQLLCFVYGQGQKREQKPRTKNFVEFHNHLLHKLWFAKTCLRKSWQNTFDVVFKVRHL